MVKFTNFQKNKIGLVLIILILFSSFGFAQGTSSTTLPRSNPGHPIGQIDCGVDDNGNVIRCDATGPNGTPNKVIDYADQAELALSLLYTPAGTGSDTTLRTKFVEATRLSPSTELSDIYLLALSGTGGVAQHIKVGYADIAGSLDSAAANDVMFKSVYDKNNTGPTDGVVDAADKVKIENAATLPVNLDFGFFRFVPSTGIFNGISDLYVTQKIVEGTPIVTTTFKKLRAGYADEALKSSGSFTVTGPYLIFNVPDTGGKYATRLIAPGDINNIALAPGAAWDDSQGAPANYGSRDCLVPGTACNEPLIGTRLVINPEGHFDKGVQIGWPDRSPSSNNQNAWIDHTNKAGDLYVAGNLEVDGSTYLGDVATDSLTVAGSFTQAGRVNIGGSLVVGDINKKRVVNLDDVNNQDIFVSDGIESGGNLWVGTGTLLAALTPQQIFDKRLVVYNDEPTFNKGLGLSTSGIELINARSITGGAAGEDSQIDIGFSNGLPPLGRYAAITGIVTGTGPVGSLVFSTKSTGENDLTEKMRITSGGNVEIGNPPPLHEADKILNIQGNTKISGNLDVGIDANINGKLCFIQDVSGVPTPVCEDSWDSVGNIRGSGRAGQLAMFTPDGTHIGNSVISQNEVNNEYVIKLEDTLTPSPLSPKKVNLDVSGSIKTGGLALARVGTGIDPTSGNGLGFSNDYAVDVVGKKLKASEADVAIASKGAFVLNDSNPTPQATIDDYLKINVYGILSGTSVAQRMDKVTISAEDDTSATNLGHIIINRGNSFGGGVIVDSDLLVNGKITGDGSGLNGVGGGWNVDTTDANNKKTTTTYNVGVGTASPNEQLEVAASGGGRLIVSDGTGVDRRVILLQAPTATQDYGRIVAHKYGTSVGGKNLVLQDTGGNVGIGGFSSTITPSAELHIKGNGIANLLKVDSSDTTRFTPPTTVFAVGNNGNIQLGYSGADSAAKTTVTTIYNVLRIQKTTESMATPTGTCTIDDEGKIYYNNGKLKICDGTSWQDFVTDVTLIETDPQVNLLTGSKWCVSNAGGTAIDCTQNAPLTAETDPQVNLLTGSKWCVSNAGGTAIDCTQNAPSNGWTADTTKTITNLNVGIGTTTSPKSKLTVATGTVGDSGEIEFRLGSNDGSARDLIIRKDTTTPYGTSFISAANPTVDSGTFRFYTSDRAAGERMVITSSGNVGIGTSNPGAKLEVNNGQILINEPTGDAALRFKRADGKEALIDFDSGSKQMEFRLNCANAGCVGVGDVSKLSITDNGNVGIGTTTNLNEKLNIAGAVKLIPESTRASTGCDSNHEGAIYYDSAVDKVKICTSPGGWDDFAGSVGADGKGVVTTVVSENNGANCANGGYKISFYRDVNNDGTYQTTDTPLLGTSYSCKGNVGAQGPAGADGTDGKGVVTTVVSENNGANCANGGYKISFYRDVNNDGTYQTTDTPLLGTSYSCKGDDGATGAQGPAGPTLGIYDSLGLTSSGSRAAGDAGSGDIYNLGNVGIGTSTAPSDPIKLEVKTTSGNSVIKISSTNAYSAVDFYNGNTNEWGIGKDTNNIFYISETGVGNHLIIKPGGNVGIGIATPSAQLHVNKNTAGWASIIENTNTLTSDVNGGLLIKAGEDSSDTALAVQNKAGSNLLKVDGNGNVLINQDLTVNGQVHMGVVKLLTSDDGLITRSTNIEKHAELQCIGPARCGIPASYNFQACFLSQIADNGIGSKGCYVYPIAATDVDGIGGPDSWVIDAQFSKCSVICLDFR